MKRSLMITIDWDYFIDLTDTNFSHKEAPFFLNDMWMLRFAHVDKITRTDEAQTFWQTLIDNWDITPANAPPLFVSDSHSYAGYLASQVGDCDILNFDQHHDAWDVRDESLRVSHCDDWVSVHLTREPDATCYWIRPDFFPKNIGAPVKWKDRIICDDYPNVHDYDICTIHVARSGCWTPPWCDKNFIGFVHGPQVVTHGPQVVTRPIWPINNMQAEGIWNPLLDRWFELKDKTLMLRDQMKGLYGDAL